MSDMTKANAQLTPYARSLGIEIEGLQDGVPLLAVEFSSNVEGRPTVFHGGATAGLLETAGYAALRAALAEREISPALKPVNITTQYLSAAKSKRTYAMGRITRLGRRSANVAVEAWQDDRTRPVATAIMNILMVGPDEEA